MEYTISDQKDYVVIKFKGRILGTGGDEFREKVRGLIDEGKIQLIGDLSDVSFINSTGLGILISVLTTLRKADGDIILCGANDHVKTLFRVSKLFTLFDHYDSLEKAAATYK